MDFSFEEALRVAVIGPLEFIKGVQWELNKRSSKKIELFQWKFSEQAIPQKIHALVFFVEHAMQIPVQHLRNFPRVSSLAVFESMNPSQILGLGQLSSWRMSTWEEGRYDKIATLLLEELNARSASEGEEKTIQQLKQWLKEQGDSPSRIVWTNAPASWSGAKELALPANGAPFILGSLDSTADFKLPLSGKGEWAILQKSKHGLQFRSLLAQLPVQFFGDPSQLKAGDRLKIFEFNFELAASSEWVSLKNFLRKRGVSSEAPAAAGPRTLADTLRDILDSGNSGELVVRSENRIGYLAIQEGYLEDALVGPVSGLKALFRILSWPAVQSQFERQEKSNVPSAALRLNSLDFQKAYDRWKQRVAQLKPMWPPHQLRVQPDPAGFMKKKTWITKDFLVFCALCENDRIYSVMNACPLLDIEIVESMIGLRKEGLLKIQQ